MRVIVLFKENISKKIVVQKVSCIIISIISMIGVIGSWYDTYNTYISYNS